MGLSVYELAWAWPSIAAVSSGQLTIILYDDLLRVDSEVCRGISCQR